MKKVMLEIVGVSQGVIIAICFIAFLSFEIGAQQVGKKERYRQSRARRELINFAGDVDSAQRAEINRT